MAIQQVMSLRHPAIAIGIGVAVALVAVACVSSRLVASIVGIVTIAAVLIDVLTHQPRAAGKPPRDKLQVDLVNRGTRR
jgi:hypothetical protein